jgi:hypothetical protein
MDLAVIVVYVRPKIGDGVLLLVVLISYICFLYASYY